MNSDIDPKWGQPDPTHDPYALAHFQARPSDILITTAPKAGTTWMQQILHQLRSGGDESFCSIDDVVPWLELPREGKSWQQVLAAYEQLPDPRIFKTHCTYEQTPGVETVKIILTSRNPGDCCVSFYHHIMDMTEDARMQHQIKTPISFDAYFEQWLESEVWFRNIKSWWPHFNDSNVLWLRYEDLVEDFQMGIDCLLDFLGWSISAAQRDRITRNCSFQWMKTHVDKFARHDHRNTPIFRKGGFIRKGTVGDHKSLMSAAQARRIADKAQSYLDPDCVQFLQLGN